MLSVHSRPEQFKMKQSPVILGLCLSQTRARKSADYRDHNVFRLPKKKQKKKTKKAAF